MQQHEHPHGGETLRQAVITQPGDTQPQDLITFDAAAAFLGFKKSYLYKLTSTRQIPFYKYGGRLIMFDRAALETWRAARLQAVPTQAEQAARAAAYCAANPLQK